MNLKDELKRILPALATSRIGLHAAGGSTTGLHEHRWRYGFSHEFAEHRDYVPGDDLRQLDWKAFARTDRLHSKRFRDESNRLGHVLLDTAAGMNFRGGNSGLSKLEYAKLLGAAILWMLLRDRERFALSLLDGEERRSFPPGNRPSDWQRLIDGLEELHGAAEPISMENAPLTFFVSDLLFDEPDQVVETLRRMQGKRGRRRLLVLHVLDPAELEFPFREFTQFRDMKTSTSLPAVESARIRNTYLQEAERFLETVRIGCRSAGIVYELFRTDVPVVDALKRFLGDLETVR